MKELNEIIDLLDRYKTTDSISEKDQLEDDIHNWAFNILRTIEGYEDKLNIKNEFRISKQDWNPLKSIKHGYYKVFLEDGYVEILHEFSIMGESQEATITIPNYIFEDFEAGLLRYQNEKKIAWRNYNCKKIMDLLTDAKSILNDLDDIPEEYQTIINNNFWELI